MATSAATLQTIIDTLSKKYKFNGDEAIKILSADELLPKKMIPKGANDDGNIWASKKAEELASQYKIVPTGDGSGKNGKWTLKDIEKLLEKPTKSKINISPNALNLANEKGLSLSGKTGTGKDGRILLKDVENWIKSDDNDEDDDLNISPRALMEAQQSGLSDGDLTSINGTGKDGRILLEDVKKYITSTETDDSEDDESSSEDEDDKKPDRKKKTNKKK